MFGRYVLKLGRALTKATRKTSVRFNQKARMTTESSSGEPLAGLIIIGDEILSGQTRDTNSHFMCKRLYDLGVRVARISVIPDELETIASEVRRFSDSYNHVITSGGIGPTHDDLTFQGIAKAFGHECHHHPELLALIKKWVKSNDESQPHFKMAFVSKEATLKFGLDPKSGEKTNFPIVCLKNVYAFPGVPHLLEHAFPLVEKDLFETGANPTFHKRLVYLNARETMVTSVLYAFNEAYASKGLRLGSYPDSLHSYYKVKLTLESMNSGLLEQGYSQLISDLRDHVVDFDADPSEHFSEKLDKFVEKHGKTQFGAKLNQTIKTIEECLDRYSMDEICLAFNGGKDCTVLLYLLGGIVKKRFPDREAFKALYIKRGKTFPEVETFVSKMAEEHRLQLLTVTGGFKDSLTRVKEDHPELKAILMGTRQTDPYSSHLNAFSPTDEEWPSFMRVNPILSWSFTDVWTFIRSLYLPYCPLYDRGYTSLGLADNTFPCPKLEFVNEFGQRDFLPAYKLKCDDGEREGRMSL